MGSRSLLNMKNLRTYLLGDGGVPPHVELYRELRRKEFARRRGGK
jgi:carbon-monoxide dehydrogenase iron sulfur subunit